MLLEAGPQTLSELVALSGFKLPAVRRALLVLVQHGMVHCHQPAPGAKDAPPARRRKDGSVMQQYVYEVCLPRMLHALLRTPTVLVKARDDMGEVTEKILETLMEHGRLTLAQLQACVAPKLGGAEGEGVSEELREQLDVEIVGLAHAHYIEQAPTTATPPPWVRNKPNLPAAAGAPSKPKGVSTAVDSVNQYYYAGASRYNQVRFQLPPGLEARVRGLAAAGKVNPQKRKWMALSEGQDYDEGGLAPMSVDEEGAGGDRRGGAWGNGAGGGDAAVQWRVNFDEFNRRFRHAACADLVRQKLSGCAAAVIEAMLSAGRRFETKVDEARSVPLSVQDVFLQLRDSGSDMSLEEVGAELDELNGDPLELISLVGDTPGGVAFCVNMSRILEFQRLKEVEAGVRDRFGPLALRIFRLLVIKRQLEQKQIADMAMIPTKETREILYRLLRHEYVSLQEVSRSTDHAPTRTFYLWRVDTSTVAKRYMNDLLFVGGNLVHRLQHEIKKGEQVIDAAQAALASQDSASGSARVGLLMETHKEQFDRMKRMVAGLETLLHRCDDAIALFADY